MVGCVGCKVCGAAGLLGVFWDLGLWLCFGLVIFVRFIPLSDFLFLSANLSWRMFLQLRLFAARSILSALTLVSTWRDAPLCNMTWLAKYR